jgi:hypothetical protein
MKINNDSNLNFNFDNRKKILYKYFEKQDVNIIKINTYPNYENLFLIYNENIKESIVLLKLHTNNKESVSADFEINEINLTLDESFPIYESCPNTKAYKILGVLTHLDKLYIVNNLLSVFIIDLNSEEKKIYKLKIDKEDFDDNIELCDYPAFTIAKPKIVFSGGIGKEKKINKNIYSFDISTYKFELNIVRENNFIERYRHGMYSDSLSHIYVIGGFTKILTEEQIEKINEENSREFICDKIQLIKFDNLMETYVEMKFSGKAPKLMIDPYIQVFNQRFLFAFSKFKYEKIWYLDINSNNSNEISLNYLAIPRNLNIYNGFFYSEKDNCFVACYPIYGDINKDVWNENENCILSNRIMKAEDENKFNFAIKYLPIQEENIK